VCTILLRLDPTGAEPVVVAANRDEFRDRPSAGPAALAPGRFGGRDLRAGGTWLAVAPSGLAAVTNVRAAAVRPTARSRGELPLAALADGLPERFDEWNAFNLLVVREGRARVITHLADGSLPRVETLPPGTHVIVNEPFGAPCPRRWRAADMLGESPPDFRHLGDHGPPEDAGLCHHGRDYGTVSATVVALGAEGAVTSYRHCAGLPCRSAPVDLTAAARAVTRSP
jgi:uncharacterized protein with NRDE domain